MDPFNQTNQKKKSPPKLVSTENFIEALKGIGSGVAHGLNPFAASGEIRPNDNLDFDALQKERAEQQTQLEHRRLHQVRIKEELVFSAREEEVKRQIESLKMEIKKLAAEMQTVAQEIQVAAMQETHAPGTYHVGFFEHLRRLISFLREKLHESASWMKATSDRSGRKKGYWGMFAKQGTSFSQNEERKLTTSSG